MEGVSAGSKESNNCLAGRPCRILFHTWLESSGSCFGQFPQSLVIFFYRPFPEFLSAMLLDNLLEMVEIEKLALSNRPTEWVDHLVLTILFICKNQ